MTLSTRNGYVFESEVADGLEVAGLHFFKIPDSKAVGRVIPIKVPADFMYTFKGVIYTLEAKQTKMKRMPWRNFREHQIEWVLANPHTAAFIINCNNRRFGADKINKTYIVTAADIKRLQLKYAHSVPIGEFATCVELNRMTKRHHPKKKGAFIEYKHLKW